MLLGMGVLFSMLYVSSIRSGSDTTAHYSNVIPTRPKISQLQAMETVERHIRSEIKDVQKIRLDYQLYNFSWTDYYSNDPVYASEYAQYRQKIGYSWDLVQVKNHPELLNLRLFYLHANNTVYEVNYRNNTYQKACERPALTCHITTLMETAAKGKLVYFTDVLWTPQPKDLPNSEGDVLVDAETGKIVWSAIEYLKNIRPEPNVIFSDKTVSQMLKERPNPPPQITNVEIENGASSQSAQKSYFPKEVRVTIGMNNRVVWTNRDNVPESVVSDSGYVDKSTGKKFESGLISPGGAFEFTFTKEGEYTYHAEAHPWMTGRVVVLQNFS